MLKTSLSTTFYTALLISALSLNALALNAFAAETPPEEREIYKKTNKAGVVEFSDMPNHDAKPIRVPAMNTYKQKPLPRKSVTKTSTSLATSYKEFSIASPPQGKEVRENSGNVSVQLNISPSLKTSHTVKVIIDNNNKSSLTGTSLVYSFSNLSRGTHKVQAFVLDAKNTVLIESAVVEFHLKRFIFKPPAPKAKPKP